MAAPDADALLNVVVRAERADLASSLVRIRALQSFDLSARRYPIQRSVQAAARRPLEELLDELALHSGYAAHRVDATTLLLDGPGVFATVRGARKTDYSSLTLEFWAVNLERFTAARTTILSLVGEQLRREAMFTIDWHFSSGHLGLTSVPFDEVADPPLFDEAYPALLEPVAALIQRYVDARETVLILQGPPGTGKTRLVRAILAALSVRKGDSAKVLYTADRRALEGDEIYVDFITGSHDAFVVEDADYLLQARANGNLDLHRFLAIADGVVRAQGRKIIFTTNLPNLSDIDEALIRPGRCFATLRTRALDRSEAQALLARMRGPVAHAQTQAADGLLPDDMRSVTLAQLYQVVESRVPGWLR